MFKKTFRDGVEYHFPERFSSLDEYLESVTEPVISDAVKLELKWEEVRSQRDALIRSTDWVLAVDSPVSEAKKTEVMEYRQALRDTPQNQKDPFNIEWPIPPKLN